MVEFEGVVSQIRNQALEVHQLEDGSISWNSSSVAVEYTSVGCTSHAVTSSAAC